MSLRFHCFALVCLAAALPGLAQAKPIAWEDGTTVMGEYGDAMQEYQVFHAPSYRWSAGGGWLRLEPDDGAAREIGYARVNALVKRWNLPRAQANAFAWGGVGSARSGAFADRETAWNAGGQVDYETLRLYGSLRSDWHYARDAFAYRTDTLQLGWAPYAHDWDRLATWLLFQARGGSAALYDDIETAVLLRLFRNFRQASIWIEAGVSDAGDPQAMFMFNF